MSSQNQSDSRSVRPRIGTLITPTDPYWIQASEAILQASVDMQNELVVLQPAATIDDLYSIPTDSLVDQILAHELDALITNMVSVPLYQALVSERLPIVCVSEVYAFQAPLFTAMSTLYEGGKIAGQYIAEKLDGKGHAICVTASLERSPTVGQSRHEGFRDALKPYPAIIPYHVPAYWDYAQAYLALLSALDHYPYPIDAIFGVSDAVILAARDAARKMGAIGPETILVGINGDPLALAAIAEGELSATIDTASEELGAGALKLALRAAAGETLPAIVNQRFQLITRENVASIATRKLNAIASIPTHMVGYNRGQELDRLSQFEISTEITRQIGSLFDQSQLVKIISELVRKHYGYEWTRILRRSESSQKLEFYGGELSPASKHVPIEYDWLLDQVVLSNEVAFIPDLRTSHRWHMGKEWASVRARAVLPILLGSQVIGILDLQSSHPVRQPTLEIVGLKLLASQIGIAIRNADLYQEALQARKTAESANQLKNRLIANVGHEMRTPLNSILGFSQSIQKQIKFALESHEEQAISLPDLQLDLHHIYQSGEHLMYMINDLLDLSRAEIGALSLYFEQFQLAPLLNELFITFSSSSISQEVHWVLDIPSKLPLIRADGVRLRQILTNLLANAQKLTRQGSITLGAEVAPPHLHLWVNDTGPGVPTELQEKIFEPFSNMIQKRRPEGIGLGLSITRHLVLLHGGIITLESQSGIGSTFHVYLPLPGIAQEPLPAPQPDGELLLLVITDQASFPKEILEICARQRLQPSAIRTRNDLANALAKGKPVAVAWNLAHLSAGEWEMVQQLSSTKDYAALPVILYGANPAENQIQAGLTNVFFKPCNNNVLKDWIHQIDQDSQECSSILIVDDDAQAREYYIKLLESSHAHHRILQAENGRQAISILASETPAFILLDLMMPDINGFEVLAWVRAEARTQCIPVILISGRLLDYNDIQRLNYFRTAFLTKDILNQDETLAYLNKMKEETWPIPQPTSQLVKQALVYLHQNYSMPVSRKNIAETVGVSENYLSQIFRQETALSPWDYLSRYRIHKAKEMLIHSDETITNIALKVGFNDPAYFSRVFHKITGHSPQEYRQTRS